MTNELKPEHHVWLRVLSGRLEKQDIQNLLTHILQLSEKSDRENADAVLEVALKANANIMEELIGDVNMSEELLEIVKPIIEPHILIREKKALDTGIIGAVKMLRDIGCEDSKIKTMITAQYNLTAEEANRYL